MVAQKKLGGMVFQKFGVVLLIVGMIASAATLGSAAEEEGLIKKLFKASGIQKVVGPKEKALPAAAPKLEPRQAIPPETAPAAPQRTEVHKKMSRTEMIQEIKDELDSERDILDAIPELKIKKDETGKDSYVYRVNEKDVRLEDLDDAAMEKLLQRVYNQAALIRTERINQQLEIIRQTEARRALRVPPRPPSAVVRPLAPASPPQSPPSQPPSIVTPPKPPPQPPRR